MIQAMTRPMLIPMVKAMALPVFGGVAGKSILAVLVDGTPYAVAVEVGGVVYAIAV
jgi:hypothetical protein